MNPLNPIDKKEDDGDDIPKKLLMLEQLVSSSTSSSTRTVPPSLLGTWTFSQEVSIDVGYYRVMVYLVMHLMPDPMQIYHCQKKHCNELDNQVCQLTNQCISTVNNTIQWSDVSAFFNFGFQVDDGVVWREHIRQNTSDWIGPYNLLLAPNATSSSKMTETMASSLDGKKKKKSKIIQEEFVSRYVSTMGTDYLKAPSDISIVQPELFDLYLGKNAVQNTIAEQVNFTTNVDPYGEEYKGSGGNRRKHCRHKNVTPFLPRFTVTTTTTTTSPSTAGAEAEATSTANETLTEISGFTLDFDIWSILPSTDDDPKKKDPLFKLWPSLTSRVDFFDGPFCYDQDPNRAYQFQMSVNVTKPSTTTTLAEKVASPSLGWSGPGSWWNGGGDDGNDDTTNGWIVTQGCKTGLPCWPGDDNPSDSGKNSTIPSNDDSNGTDVTQAMLTYGLYFLIIALILSLTCNCQLSRKLSQQRQRYQQQQQQHQRHSSRSYVPPLAAHDGNGNGNGNDEEAAVLSTPEASRRTMTAPNTVMTVTTQEEEEQNSNSNDLTEPLIAPTSTEEPSTNAVSSEDA